MKAITKSDSGKPQVQQPEPTRYLSPAVNISETAEGFILEAEMPGVNKDTLELLLENNELTITGRRSHRLENAELLYRESAPLDYRRVFELDPSIDGSRVSARVDQGVLTLVLPKAEAVKPRKIAVTD